MNSLTTRSLGRRACALVCTLTVWLAAHAGVAEALEVSGRVVDHKGTPIEYANVSVPAFQIGTLTDADGRFTLGIEAGLQTLEVSQLGYAKVRKAFDIRPGLALLTIVLREEPVPVDEVVVAASSFGQAGKAEGAVVRRMDIVTTPGGAADVFQALRALPGINAPNEGAAVYVRGGKPSETLIRLDGGDMGHPYHYEGASGGLFSSIDAYLLKSVFFSSGGFSAKYGGVLSGVLDIETEDGMNWRSVSLGANIAGANLSTSWTLVPDRLSFVGSLKVSKIDLLEQLYGSAQPYTTVPRSADGVARLLYRYSPTGKLSLLHLNAGDDVGVLSRTLNFEGTFDQSAHNRFTALQFRDVVAGKIAVRGQASYQRYQSEWSYGPMAASEHERNKQGNIDAVWPASARHELSFGGNYRQRRDDISGRFPADSTDFLPGAPTRQINTRAEVGYPGFYLEDKMRVFGSVYATVGGRLDYATTPGTWTADPRFALAWLVNDDQTVRVAAGRYHQLADPQFLDPVYGNPQLGPLRADHVIAGYEWRSELVNVRLEGYRKDYRNLVTQDVASFYANGGRGFARGIDAFVRGRYRRMSGWLSYGYLDSKRMEGDDPRELPSAHGVRHTLTLVGTYSLSSAFQIGGRYGFSSGRAFTAVVDREFDAGRDAWKPIYGENNSDQLPAFHRLDVRLTRLFSLPAGLGLPASNICAFYVEGLNVLGIGNILEYAYNDDYSQRIETESYFSRPMLVAGVALSW